MSLSWSGGKVLHLHVAFVASENLKCAFILFLGGNQEGRITWDFRKLIDQQADCIGLPLDKLYSATGDNTAMKMP